jgi:hypothetical protein
MAPSDRANGNRVTISDLPPARLKELASYFRDAKDKKIDEIISDFPDTIFGRAISDGVKVNVLIDFARVFLCIELKSRWVTRSGNFRRDCFDRNKTLANILAEHFSEPTDALLVTKNWLRNVSDRKIVSDEYVEICWVDNLQLHLVLESYGDVPRLLVFHPASFLTFSKLAKDMLPIGLPEETLETLGLLFSSGKRTQRWFDKKRNHNRLDVVRHIRRKSTTLLTQLMRATQQHVHF